MTAFTVSNKAKADLRDIGRYTQRQWGIDQRTKYLSALDSCFHEIAAKHIEGIECSYMRPDYRSWPVGKHVVFFRWLNDGLVEIVRVLHQRMEPTRHLNR